MLYTALHACRDDLTAVEHPVLLSVAAAICLFWRRHDNRSHCRYCSAHVHW